VNPQLCADEVDYRDQPWPAFGLTLTADVPVSIGEGVGVEASADRPSIDTRGLRCLGDRQFGAGGGGYLRAM